MHVGEVIKKFRMEKKMTLAQLSKESGVALATLSRIENGRMTGTLDSHINICEALEITLPELYKYLPSSKKKLEVKTGGSEPKISVHDKRSSFEVMASNIQNKKMLPILLRIAKGAHTNTEETKPGVEKFIYIMEGKVEAFIGENKYALAQGDTIYFDSSVPHHFKNTGIGETRLMVVSCPPTS